MMRALVLIISLLVASPAAAQLDVSALQTEAVGWLQGYIRANTINPPGNEIAGAEFIAAILKKEGIPYEIVESAPGRANIWARLKGGDKPALILLHHMDVVPADRRFWSTDPLSGEIKDGLIYVSKQYFPGAPVVPAVLGGFTDSHFLRDLGISAYGYTPIVVPLEDAAGVHGNNERVSVENIRQGVAMMLDIVRRLAGK